MKKLLFLALFLFPWPLPAQQQVTVTVPIAINGLPAGCVATAAGASTINISGCPPPALPIAVSVACSPATIAPGGSSVCTATVTNASNNNVTWIASSGMISNGGVFTAPLSVGVFTVTATSVQDITKAGSATVTAAVPPTSVTVDATKPTASSGTVSVSWTGDPVIPGTTGQKLNFLTVGQTYDYNVPMVAAAVYIISARLGTDAAATGGQTVVHFEYPPGTNVSGPLALGGVNQWATVVATQNYQCCAGSAVVRLVVDAVPAGTPPTPTTGMGFIHWFQVNPQATSAHSVTLSWSPSNGFSCTPTPCTPIIPNPPPAFTYNVYRRTPPAAYGPSALAMNLTAPNFVDTLVTPGTSYAYQVTTSASGLADSAPSNEVQVTIPTGSTKGGKGDKDKKKDKH